MEDELEPGTGVTEEQQQKDSRDFAAMRKRAEKAEGERDTFRGQLIDNAITSAGFDPKLGIVQRLAKEFTGELTAEAFKEFAAAEGLTPTVETTETTTATPTERTEAEQQLDQLQGAGDRIRDASILPKPDSVGAEKAKALEAGDIGHLLDLHLANPASA